jgi:hypothetical protein
MRECPGLKQRSSGQWVRCEKAKAESARERALKKIFFFDNIYFTGEVKDIGAPSPDEGPDVEWVLSLGDFDNDSDGNGLLRWFGTFGGETL